MTKFLKNKEKYCLVILLNKFWKVIKSYVKLLEGKMREKTTFYMVLQDFERLKQKKASFLARL